jgi:hypothetical protein
MMAEDGRIILSPEDWAAKLKPAVDHSLEVSLANATNSLERQLTFVGDLKYIEFQALGVRRTLQDSYERARAVHVTADSLRPVLESDNWIAHGIYILPAVLRGGVETKHTAPGSWFDIPKNGGTTDSDIESRRILAVDCDVVRPPGTSASEEEMIRSVHVALRIWSYLEGALGDARSMAYVHSGNGRQIHLALDSLPNDEECKRFASGILIGLASLFDTPEVKVDRKLFDAKRILPACGTLKKKGAPGIPERPHRRTAIVTPKTVRRLSLDNLKQLGRIIWNDTDDDGREALGKAIGTPPPTVRALSLPADSPFARANSVPPSEVAVWLGVSDGTTATCPGCGEKSGVAVLNHGFKCQHNRCSGKGRNGFRTNVDLVAEVKSLSPREAVNVLAERFGFEGLPVSPAATPSSSPSTGFQWISTAEIFEPLPPTRWLVPSLHLVAGRPTLLAGYGSSGKTLMMQSLALALAAATPVWNKFMPAEAVHVRHLDYEQGKHATLKRYQRLCIGHGIAREQLGDRLQVAIFPDVYLDDRDATDSYAKACEGVGVVVLDALRGATPTLDENDSTIRRCLDNLSRVSEKTGTSFIVLHHAGKTQGDDPRTMPRGSSAIFDACGCVFTVSGEQNEPKQIQQTKQPAEAEGVGLAPFFLAIEDVPVDDRPTAGVRIVIQEAIAAQPKTGASAKMTALKETVFQLVLSTHGLRTKNSICDRVTGGNKSAKCTAIDELIQEGRIFDTDTGFSVVNAGPGTAGTGGPDGPSAVPSGPEPVPAGPERSQAVSRTGPSVPPPLRGDRGTGTAAHARVGPTAEERKRSESQCDADLLATMPVKERSQYMAAQGWSDGRSKRARGALALRESSIRRDAQELQKAADKGLDVAAWGTEQGWSDERIAAAKLRMEI